MKILVTGASGQLGYKIKQLLSDKYELVLTDASEMDITNKEKVGEIINSVKPDFVIHGAAYTQVDKAEENIELCEKINVLGTKNVAEIAKKYGIALIYISTDFVFDGNISGQRKQQTGYVEIDKPNPLSVYGRTKLEGEKIVEEICDKYYILRIAWLFGELPENYPGSNFVETMLRLAKEREYLTIVNDQVGSPTYTKDLVEVIDKIVGSMEIEVGSKASHNVPNASHSTPHTLRPIPYGLYHFSGKEACSWYDFACEIFKQSNMKIDIRPVTSQEFVQKATRPPYSYLNKSKIEEIMGIEVRPWKEMLKEYLDNK